jgi:outer membrane murein-binding lipoprotein Lpp
MKKLVISALIASLPGVALAGGSSTTDELNQLKAQLAAMQAKVDTLEKQVQAQNDALSPDDAAEMKESVANQQLKVDSLETAATEGPLAGLSVTGYMDPTFMYNRNSGSSSFEFANRTTSYNYDNSTIGDVYLDIKKTFGQGPTAPSAEVVIMPSRGAGTTVLYSEKGQDNSILNSAQITYPLNDQYSIIAGLMAGFGGYDVLQSNQMVTITHNLLYDFSDPGNFVGAGFTWSHGDWATKFLISNEQNHTRGNNVATANGTSANNTPTVNGRVDYTYSSAIDLGGSVTLGRQTLPTGSSTSATCATGTYGYQCSSTNPYSGFYYGEFDATYNLNDVLLNAELSYGEQQKAAFNGGDAEWYGLSLQAHEKWNTASLGRMGATLRYDYMNDSKNGGGGGTIALNGYSQAGVDSANGWGVNPDCYASNGLSCKGANRQEVTTDLLFYPTDQLTLKFEARYDWASQAVFVRNDGSYGSNNVTIGAQMVYAF